MCKCIDYKVAGTMTSEQLQHYYEKFPAVLKERLKNGALCFPVDTEFDYEPKEAYRGIIRKVGEESIPVSITDMKSYYELGKAPRGASIDESNPIYFAVSLFKNTDMLKQSYNFSNPRKFIAKGYVYKEGGPSLDGENSHISWWLFNGVNLSKFEILEKEK